MNRGLTSCPLLTSHPTSRVLQGGSQGGRTKQPGLISSMCDVPLSREHVKVF